MIKIWELDSQKKKVRQVSLDTYEIGKTLSWIDCYQPTKKEFVLLSKATGIPLDDLESSVDPNKRPHVIPYDDHSLIIFRAPHHRAKEVVTTPVGVFMFKNDVLTIHDQPVDALDEFRKLPEAQLLFIFRKGAPYFVYRFMDAAMSEFFEVLEDIGDKIERTETQVLTEARTTVGREIFTQKRTLIYSHKALIANRDVISALEKHYLKEFKKEDVRQFRDLYSDTAQLIDLVSTYRDILTSVLDMHLSTTNNNLNRVVKTLTVLSTFVLVPTLIGTVYGMNFQRVGPWSMPELYWQYGYLFALGLMLLSTIVTYVIFKKREWV